MEGRKEGRKEGRRGDQGEEVKEGGTGGGKEGYKMLTAGCWMEVMILPPLSFPSSFLPAPSNRDSCDDDA